MKKIIGWLIAVIVVLGIAFLGWRNNKSPEFTSGKPIVKIGISLPMSGNAAYVGKPAAIAANIALDKWKDKERKYEYQLIIEDDQLLPRRSATVAHKLISLDKVNAVVGLWGTSAPIFMDLARRSNIIHMACTWGDGMYADGKNNFNNITSNKHHAKKLIEIFKKKGVKNIGIVTQMTAAEERLIQTLTDAFIQAGFNVVYTQEFHWETKDFRLFFLKMKKKKADMLVISLLPPSFTVFLKQKWEMGDTADYTTIDYFDALNPALTEGREYVGSAASTDEFAKTFAEKSSGHLGDCIGNIHDDIDLLIHAFETAEAPVGQIPTTEAVVKALHDTKNWQGAVGYLTIKPDGHIDSDAIVKVVKDGKVTVVEK